MADKEDGMVDEEDGMADAEDGMADDNDNNDNDNDKNNDSNNVKKDFPDTLCISKRGDERKCAVRFVGGGVDKRTVQCWLKEVKCSLKYLTVR